MKAGFGLAAVRNFRAGCGSADESCPTSGPTQQLTPAIPRRGQLLLENLINYLCEIEVFESLQ